MPRAMGDNRGLLILKGRIKSGQEAPHHQVVQRFLVRSELVRIHLLAGGDDGMVVRDLGIIVYTGRKRQLAVLAGQPADIGRVDRRQGLHGLVDAAHHVPGQVTAVRARIGQRLAPLIQGLGGLERLVRGKAQRAVGFPLQAGQVKQLRGQLPLGLCLRPGHPGGLP